MRFLRVAAAAYLALLLLSHGVRLLWPDGDEPEPGRRSIELADGVRIAFHDWGPAEAPARPLESVVLLHGSPGSGDDFLSLGPALASRYRVLAPDFPGFGGSTRDVPDYSIEAHARDTLEFLDRRGVRVFHAVGFSMGGGVALQMAAMAPQRVRSLTLISSIGAQEMELLGDARLNTFLHELQLAFCWLVREAVPHFGAADRAFLGVPFARNFYDTNQRPLAGILTAYPGPVLIVHGRDDFLVPVEAARLHHQIAPDSRLRVLDRSHFFVFREGPMLAEMLVPFFEGRVAPEPADPAPVSRRFLAFSGQVALSAGATALHGNEGPYRLGARVAAGALSPWAVWLGAALGPWLAAVLLFALGRLTGLRWARLEGRVRLLVVAGRVVPFAWLPAAFAAGCAPGGARPFLATSLAISAAWAVLVAAAGYRIA